MKKILSVLLFTLLVFSVFAEAADAASRSKRQTARRSSGYCDSYARRVASNNAGARQVIGGAAIGAGTGALVGAIVGGHHSVGKGAAIGGIAGVVGGGITANNRWHGIYRSAYNRCMRGR